MKTGNDVYKVISSSLIQTVSSTQLCFIEVMKLVLLKWTFSEPSTATNIYSVQFSHSVVSDSLRPHEPQHTRPPCPSPTPTVHPNPCPLSWSCYRTISSSAALLSFSLQSFLESGSFQMSQLFTSGGRNIGVSASTSVLPMNTQD